MLRDLIFTKYGSSHHGGEGGGKGTLGTKI